jgi:hypothetical protein
MGYELTPGKAPVLVSGDVHFWLTIDGRAQHYVVSHEALEDHFGDTILIVVLVLVSATLYAAQP